jgi:RimJ/RimL family protein N-acetyltransferase
MSHEAVDPSLNPRLNEFGQPVGKPVPGWTPRDRLPDVELTGRTSRVVPYRPEHAQALFEAYAADNGRMWTYMPFGPFADAAALHASIMDYQDSRGFHTFTILADGRALGHLSYLRYDLANGAVEIGGVSFSPALQHSTVATEAQYLLMKHAFDHGYRRYEWKCDQLNEPSNRAALRLGFTFEGTFRNAVVYKGRRRDTCWYAIIVEDWPAVRARLEAWLDPANFDTDGVQRQSLRTIPTAGEAPFARKI